MNEVDTLVFEGGSVKGLAYVGALQVLDLYFEKANQKPFLDQIQRVAGTSAGSIVALLIALGLNLKQVNFIMQNTSFSSFADSKSWYAYGNAGKGAAVYRNGYLCEGMAFMKWVESLLETYAGKKDITFAELKQKTNKDLHVYSVRLNDSHVITFNAEKTPHVAVGLAVRMSMSIPVFFKPVRVDEKLSPEGHVTDVKLNEESGTTYYVDGGVKVNYPYQLIKTSANLRDEQILGFKVDSSDEIFKNAVNQETEQYLKPLYSERTKIKDGYGIHLIPYVLTALMSPQEDAHNTNTIESTRTIRCWDCNISTFDFDLSKDKIDGLLASGAQSATTFINKIAALKDFSVAKQIEAVKMIPKEELAFAGEYGKQEAERVKGIAKDIKHSAESTNMPLDFVEQQHLESLKADMERLQNNFNYHIDRTLKIEGTVKEEAGVSIGNVTNLPKDIEFFKEAAAHVQKMTDKGIKSVTIVEKEASVKSVRDEIGNLDFGAMGSKDAKSEQTSVLDRMGMFSPKLLDVREFVKKAEGFNSTLMQDRVYKDDKDIIELSKELQEILSDCRKDIKAVTKEQRNAVREKIQAIEGQKAIIDTLQKKVSANQ